MLKDFVFFVYFEIIIEKIHILTCKQDSHVYLENINITISSYV